MRKYSVNTILQHLFTVVFVEPESTGHPDWADTSKMPHQSPTIQRQVLMSMYWTGLQRITIVCQAPFTVSARGKFPIGLGSLYLNAYSVSQIRNIWTGTVWRSNLDLIHDCLWLWYYFHHDWIDYCDNYQKASQWRRPWTWFWKVISHSCFWVPSVKLMAKSNRVL